MTRLYQKYQGHSCSSEMGKDLQIHLALEEHVQTACLPPAPTERGRWRQAGEKMRQGDKKLGNTWLHSTEDSLKEVNFNSAAVASNKNLLINRHVQEISAQCECFLRALTFGLKAASWN